MTGWLFLIIWFSRWLETSIRGKSFRPHKARWVSSRERSAAPVPRESPPQGIKKEEIYKQKEQAHFVLGFLDPRFITEIAMH